ncbi:hypothetical protein [Stakelama pacifica]|uniref:Uncharacterized protein n=1 Tax=Stakelama pacifica TaxID=517720 RepID=A0A4R6FFP5_9SPHN|nr:hypothetical protein [Stakelama pacifica]MAW99337.1 hypothetical protein [Sphingomonas sp.]MAX00299.1 hypothetical protein [Sphingomonas sp.]TDN79224.1 hypothetical protein EV664_1132 [Stakelama pacifica]GGO98687.1 hypothetical protein GCM10011329_30450 [Stakelama pacifica]
MDIIYLRERQRVSLERARAATNAVAGAAHASLAGLYAEWIQQHEDIAAGRSVIRKYPIHRV